MYTVPFKDRSLREKLTQTGFLLTAMMMAVLLVALLTYQLIVQRNALAVGVRAHAMVIGSNGAAAIMFRDAQEAQETLASLKHIPDITWAAFLLPGGQELATYQRGALEAGIEHAQTEGIGWSALLVREPVMLHGQHIGTVAVQASLASLYSGLALQTGFGVLAAALALFLSLVFSRRMASSIVQPLLSLVQLTEQVRAKRDFSLRATLYGSDEAGRLARSFNDLMAQLEWHDARTNAELQQRRLAEQQLNKLAYYDLVTGLHNRHYFKEKLETAVAEAMHYGTSCAVLFIDLDDFKVVNDTLGHETGDTLLTLVAKRLRGTLRSIDVVCRIGGDEFAVILESGVGVDQVSRVASNIVGALSIPFNIEDHQINIGASLGISLCPDHASDTVSLVRNADMAMYHAKANGKNSFYLHAPQMDISSVNQ